MRLSGFPACCTAMVLHDFSGSAVASNAHEPATTTEALVEYILSSIRWDNSMAFVSATTNNEQTMINSGLELLGFESTPWLSKRAHSETRVKLWWLAIEDVTPELIEGWRVLLSNIQEKRIEEALGYETP